MRSLKSLSAAGKRVLMRVDFNVPLHKETRAVTDDTRIRAAMPSIKYLLDQPGTSLVLMSHLGRPKGGAEDKYSLRHILPVLSELLGREVLFAPDCVGEASFELSHQLKAGGVLLLENVRFHPEDEQGNSDFAERLSRHGSVYVNDAFGAAHREHASTATVARFFGEDKAAGFLMEAEVKNADKVMEQAERPFTAIMGGAKVSDKILIIENLMDRVDNLVIVGAMAYTFMRAMGGQTGASLCEEDKLDLARTLMHKAEQRGVRWVLPVDSVAADRFAADAQTAVVNSNEIPDGWMGLDIGPKAADEIGSIIMNSRTLLWNGPAGVFEMDAYANGSRALRRTSSPAIGILICSFSFNSRNSSTVAHGCSTYSSGPMFSKMARRFVTASCTDQLPLTSIRSAAWGRNALTLARRAISSGRFSPTFTLKVFTPGKEFTMPSISLGSLSAGIVPLTFTEVR